MDQGLLRFRVVCRRSISILGYGPRVQDLALGWVLKVLGLGSRNSWDKGLWVLRISSFTLRRYKGEDLELPSAKVKAHNF